MPFSQASLSPALLAVAGTLPILQTTVPTLMRRRGSPGALLDVMLGGVILPWLCQGSPSQSQVSIQNAVL